MGFNMDTKTKILHDFSKEVDADFVVAVVVKDGRMTMHGISHKTDQYYDAKQFAEFVEAAIVEVNANIGDNEEEAENNE